MPVPPYASQREIQARINKIDEEKRFLLMALERHTQRALRETGLSDGEWKYLTWEQREAWVSAAAHVGALAWSEMTRDQRALRVVIELERVAQ